MLDGENVKNLNVNRTVVKKIYISTTPKTEDVMNEKIGREDLERNESRKDNQV